MVRDDRSDCETVAVCFRSRCELHFFSDDGPRIQNFNAWWGPESHKLTEEEKAAIINRALDDIEAGNATEITDFDEDAA